jgi:excinuclease ABC subunit B
LIQTAGRAARHAKGRGILYADEMNDSLRRTLEIINGRRGKQEAYNREHGITPKSVVRAVQESLHLYGQKPEEDPVAVADGVDDMDVQAVLAELQEDMLEASRNLEFERAAVLRDQIQALKEGKHLGSATAGRKKKGKSTYRQKRVQKGSKFSPGRRRKPGG